MTIHSIARPPTPRLPHPHLDHHSVRGPHVQHSDMDAYAISLVHKKNKHEPKKGGTFRKRSRRDANDDASDGDGDANDDESTAGDERVSLWTSASPAPQRRR